MEMFRQRVAIGSGVQPVSIPCPVPLPTSVEYVPVTPYQTGRKQWELSITQPSA